MKISPIATSSNAISSSGPVSNPQANRELAPRTITMRTNVNPTHLDQPPQAQIQHLPPAQRPMEADPNNPTDTAEATQPLSPQFAALAKQRRALQVRERELQAKEKALSSPQSDGGTIALAQLKASPLKVLLESGITYEQLTEEILANQGNSEIAVLKAELNAIRDGVDQKLTARDAQTEQQVLSEMRREATNLAAQGDDFELVRGMQSVPDVMKLIERTYRETGDVLDVREAMQLVEDELFKDIQKMTSFKKVQSQYPATPPMQRQSQGMRTLTNRDTASVQMSAKARALAAFNGTLRR